ncbi:MAG: hypothetical protein KBB64_06040 [Bacteroidia bacterium]|nr:hypothetical protein [Bacteroidia bacterium]
MDYSTDLTYNIATLRLYGVIDGKTIDVLAHSGGRGGTKTPGAKNFIIANNPFLTHHGLNEKLKNKGAVGGPLPMGTYTMTLHREKNKIRLNPTANVNMHGRSGGFLIHGRGPRGSDGCIVPEDFEIVKMIYNEVEKRIKDGISPMTIRILAIGDIDYYQRLLSIV